MFLQLCRMTFLCLTSFIAETIYILLQPKAFANKLNACFTIETLYTSTTMQERDTTTTMFHY